MQSCGLGDYFKLMEGETTRSSNELLPVRLSRQTGERSTRRLRALYARKDRRVKKIESENHVLFVTLMFALLCFFVATVNSRTFPNVNTLTATDLPVRSQTQKSPLEILVQSGVRDYNTRQKYRRFEWRGTFLPQVTSLWCLHC